MGEISLGYEEAVLLGDQISSHCGPLMRNVFDTRRPIEETIADIEQIIWRVGYLKPYAHLTDELARTVRQERQKVMQSSAFCTVTEWGFNDRAVVLVCHCYSGLRVKMDLDTSTAFVTAVLAKASQIERSRICGSHGCANPPVGVIQEDTSLITSRYAGLGIGERLYDKAYAAVYAAQVAASARKAADAVAPEMYSEAEEEAVEAMRLADQVRSRADKGELEVWRAGETLRLASEAAKDARRVADLALVKIETQERLIERGPRISGLPGTTYSKRLRAKLHRQNPYIWQDSGCKICSEPNRSWKDVDANDIFRSHEW
ncbi:MULTISPECIES: hypothetical protein [unclassified Mycobacterium]|uniref:hypothetical protein n=1 Tax=unclassified Mycobacterium TaxID=2642494 RepID=UPI0009939127|nr:MULTISPECIES: hypothetical protein [unclassified Mycobacterium]